MLAYKEKGGKEVAWRKTTLEGAIRWILKEFDEQPERDCLALVWRKPDEYTVMDNWLLSHVMKSMSASYMRVVMWITREEAARMVNMLKVVR